MRHFSSDGGLAAFLLNGLPADEREHVVNVISQQRRDDLRRLRIQGAPNPTPEVISLTDGSRAESAGVQPD